LKLETIKNNKLTQLKQLGIQDKYLADLEMHKIKY